MNFSIIFVDRILYKVTTMSRTVKEILTEYPPKKKEVLLPVLQEIQKEFGILNEASIEEVSRYTNLPSNKIYGVAAFYDQFRFLPKGKFHIQICRGTSCYLHGSLNYVEVIEKQLKVKTGGVSRDGKYSLELVTCLGACEHSPIVKVNDTYYKNLNPDKLSQLLKMLKEKTISDGTVK